MQHGSGAAAVARRQTPLQFGLLEPVRLQQLVDLVVLVVRQIYLGQLLVVRIEEVHHRRRSRFPFDAEVLVRVGKPEAFGFEEALDVGQPVQLSAAAGHDFGVVHGAVHHGRGAAIAFASGGRRYRQGHGHGAQN